MPEISQFTAAIPEKIGNLPIYFCTKIAVMSFVKRVLPHSEYPPSRFTRAAWAEDTPSQAARSFKGGLP